MDNYSRYQKLRNKYCTILDAYYNPIGDIYMVPGGYLYRTVEQLNQEWKVRDDFWIMRDIYLQHRRDNPYYTITGS